MNRRRLLTGVAGAVPAGVLAHEFRADIRLDPAVGRAQGSPAAVVVPADSRRAAELGVDPPADGSWKDAARSALPTAANDVVERRTEASDLGLTYGISAHLFGLAVKLSVTRASGQDGNLVGESPVGFFELKQTAPSTVSVTVTHEGARYRSKLPVAVSQTRLAQQSVVSGSE